MRRSILSPSVRRAARARASLSLLLAACGSTGRPASHAQATLSSCGDLAACRAACEGGSGGSCYAVGAMHETGSGAPQSYANARTFYSRACDASEPRGCNDLGVIEEIGLAGAANVSEAVSLYRRACDGGDAEGCANLSLHYEEGNGVTKDPARARTLRKSACLLGVSHACRPGD